jgi:hypothetical protein
MNEAEAFGDWLIALMAREATGSLRVEGFRSKASEGFCAVVVASARGLVSASFRQV